MEHNAIREIAGNKLLPDSGLSRTAKKHIQTAILSLVNDSTFKTQRAHEAFDSLVVQKLQGNIEATLRDVKKAGSVDKYVGQLKKHLPIRDSLKVAQEIKQLVKDAFVNPVSVNSAVVNYHGSVEPYSFILVSHPL
ncbi:hypothetical protein [Paraflavitalea speifideaquila]|uniref:hypothetical protein n=1 Tax=Paraflavitalea speifideaquila TaxID=3076558 RepID=UPI0028F0F8AD|nr:hypothetical protein [Paraflavitalea speifideiaquila]